MSTAEDTNYQGVKHRLCLRFQVCSPLFEIELVVLVYIGRLQCFLDVEDLLAFEGQFVQHLLVSLR